METNQINPAKYPKNTLKIYNTPESKSKMAFIYAFTVK